MAGTEQTLILIKPDAIQQHYAEHVGKPFFAGLVDYITSRPIVAIVFEGPQAVAAARASIGSTKPVEAAPGTIRGDYGLMVGRNLIHGSDSPESAAREIGIFFPGEAPFAYEREIDTWVLE